MGAAIRLLLLIGLLLALAGCVAPRAASAQSQDGWRLLFNGENLDGWYTWLPAYGRDQDPRGVFTIRDGMLHILDIPVTGLDEEFGYIATREEFADYRLRFQYRWGQKKFAPRADLKRDSGLLYHVVGADLIWPRSLESQVQEGDTGDLFMVGGTSVRTTVDPVADPPTFLDGGVPHTQTGGLVVKGGTYELADEWNSVEVIVSGADSAHIVNGVLNARAADARQPDSTGQMIPLTRGRILLQAEGAEIFYRNVALKQLSYTPPPPGATVLFGGADASRWQSVDPTTALGWSVVDGALQVCPTCPDIRTVDTFGDFRLHVEFWSPSTPWDAPEQDRGNSGVYLQSRYEVQVLDSWGRTLSGRNDAGAIYGVKDADTNAALPTGVWQSYDVVFHAARWVAGAKVENARATLFWNGDLVQNDVAIPGPTGAGEPETPDGGPIRLQTHGNAVRYRNIWIQQ